jgi:hypothetical protein
MRLSIRKRHNGQWAEFSRDGSFYTFTVADTEEQARMLAIKRRAIEAHREFERYHQALESIGAVDISDPYGYLA